MPESPFSPEVRARAIALGHRDPDLVYREMMLDVRVGGPVSHEILSALSSRPMVGMTAAETEIVGLLCVGFDPAEIAALRVVQTSSVYGQIKGCRLKLGARSTAHLTAMAVARAAAGDGGMEAALLKAVA